MSSAAQRLDAHRRENLSRLGAESSALAANAGALGRELVVRHPLAAVASVAVLSTCVAATTGTARQEAKPKRRLFGAATLLGLLRRSAFAGLASALQASGLADTEDGAASPGGSPQRVARDHPRQGLFF
jgi:hypothetical protein